MPIERHPRSIIVQTAATEIGSVINELTLKHNLTIIELIRILIAEIQVNTAYLLREERHGRMGKRADEA